MHKLLRKMMNTEKGQALPAVLILLCLGGLLISPSLSFASTSLNSGQNTLKSIRGVYAADAGVMDTIWCLKNGAPTHTSLSETLNGMTVTIETEDKGDYLLYAGEWITGSGHMDYLEITGEMVWDGGASVYKYTITVTRQPQATGNIKVTEIGAKLPVGYSYQTGSAALFAENLSDSEPDDEVDGDGAHMLSWGFSPPCPTLTEEDPTRTQTFYSTGTGELEGHYAWVIVSREDVGTVSELNGSFYIITATATEGSETAAVITADVMLSEGVPYITAWQISSQ